MINPQEYLKDISLELIRGELLQSTLTYTVIEVGAPKYLTGTYICLLHILGDLRGEKWEIYSDCLATSELECWRNLIRRFAISNFGFSADEAGELERIIEIKVPLKETAKQIIAIGDPHFEIGGMTYFFNPSFGAGGVQVVHCHTKELKKYLESGRKPGNVPTWYEAMELWSNTLLECVIKFRDTFSKRFPMPTIGRNVTREVEEIIHNLGGEKEAEKVNQMQELAPQEILVQVNTGMGVSAAIATVDSNQAFFMDDIPESVKYIIPLDRRGYVRGKGVVYRIMKKGNAVSISPFNQQVEIFSDDLRLFQPVIKLVGFGTGIVFN